MREKLIIIESGSDASGKATQTAMLYERLQKGKTSENRIPNYKSDSPYLCVCILKANSE